MNALQFIQFMGVVPMSVEKPCTKPSGSELRRWLDQRAVLINGVKPTSKDEVQFPIESFVFFPKSPRRTTVI